jgi:adenylate kinase family enzyme
MSLSSNNPEGLTLNKSEAIFDMGVEKVAYDRPLLIVLYGPPGSGKSSANKMIERLFNIPIQEFIHIEKDSLVTAIRSYRKKTMEMYNELPNKNSIPQNFYEEMNDYKKFVTQVKNTEGHDIEEKRILLLQKSLDLNYNIIFDTTCDSAKKRDLLLEDIFPSIPENYDIIVLYPVVPIEVLKKRVKNRTKQQLQENPPYYRATNPVKLVETERVAKEFFISSIVPLIFSKTVKQIYMYNNEEYVSHTPLNNTNIYKTKVKSKRVSKSPSFFGYNAEGKAVEYTNSTRKTIKRRLNNPLVKKRK